MRIFFLLIFASLISCSAPNSIIPPATIRREIAIIEQFEYTGKYLDISAQTEDARATFWKPDGTLLFVIGRRSNNIAVYQLSEPWELHTASFLQQAPLPGEFQHGLFMHEDGHMMWVYDRTSIWWFQLETPWDVSTLSAGVNTDFNHFALRGHDIAFNTDGTILYIDDRNAGAVFEYSLATPWDVTSGTVTYSLDISEIQKEVRGVEFLSQGAILMLMDTDRREVLQFTLSEPWEISTAVFTGAFDVSTQTHQGRGLSFSADETIMYVTAQDKQMIFQYEYIGRGDK